MKIIEVLNEKSVESSWITNLTYNRPNKILTMTLSNGKSYSIPGITRSTFEKWAKSPSIGKYYHSFIKHKYKLSKLHIQ